jgi:hypothetical protein
MRQNWLGYKMIKKAIYLFFPFQKKFKLLRLYMHQAGLVFEEKLGREHKMTKKAHKTLLYAASKSNNNFSTAAASTSSQSGISKPKKEKQKNRQGAENGGTAGVRCVPSTSTSNRQWSEMS